MLKSKAEVFNKMMKDRESCGPVGRMVTDFLCDGLFATPEEFKMLPRRLVLPTIINNRKKNNHV